MLRHPLLLALAVGSVLAGFFWNIAQVPLFDVDEGAFSEATREMLARGDPITPTLYGELRADKPVLTYWLQGASAMALGTGELAFRLPSAIAATLWALLLYRFAARFHGPRTGLYAAILLATTLSVTAIAKAATADALLNLFLAAAVLGAFLHIRTGQRGLLYGSYAAMGLGVLTKGPVAVLIPAAVTFLFSLSRGELRPWLRAALDARGWLVLLTIALPWYAAETLRDGGAFLKGFLLEHNIGRFRAPMEGHGGALFYYLPVLLIGLLPHTGLVLAALARPRALWGDELTRYGLLWFGFVFLFFSLSGTKLPHYLNYGYTGLILLTALHLDRLSPLAAFLPALIFEAFLLALPWLLPLALPYIDDPFYREALAGARFGPGYVAFFALACLLTLLGLGDRRLPLAGKALFNAAFLTFGLSAFLYPLAGEALQGPIKEAGIKAREGKAPLVMWGLNTPSFCVYAGREAERRPPRPGDWVLTRKGRLKELAHVRVLYQKGGIALVEVMP